MSKQVIMRFGGRDSGDSGSGGGTGSTNITNVSASASTLAAGSPATAAASLTDDSLTLTFGIPQGIQGERGEQGERGIQGVPGASAVLGAAYSGTYTGTGTYGSANPNTLSFTTPPSTVIITRNDSTGLAAQMVLQQGSEQAVFTSTNTSNTYHRVNKVTWSNDGKTVSWYCAQDAGAQLNASGESYTFVAIGTGEIACTVDVGTVTTGAAGTSAEVTNSGTAQQAVFNFTIPRGDTGNGIASVTLVSTVGKVKTYRITMTDGSTFDFTVTDGTDGTGSGDMSKAVYDTDDNGIVDEAESVSNVSGTGAIEFGLDADGKGQYRAVGAATWIPFLTGGDAFDSLDTDNALYFGTEQSDEFANNGTKTFALTGLEAGKEYLLIPIQVVATGTPHMWIGGNSYTQTFSGASVVDTKSNNVLTFQKITVTANNPTMTIKNTSGYRNRFETFVFPL